MLSTGLPCVIRFRAMESTRVITAPRNGARVREATPEDRAQFFAALPKLRPQAYLEAFDFVPERFDLKGIRERWGQAGFSRERELLVAHEDGRLVAAAQTGKAPVQRLADRISSVFVPVVLVLATITFVVWLISGGGTQAAFTAAVAVLIIACPCALGLATPTALLVGTGRGAQLGILIKGPEILEQTRQIDTVVLDKTGTVTQGRMSLVDVLVPAGARSADAAQAEVLRYAGAVEALSEHPIAQAVAEVAAAAGPSAVDASSVGGDGVVIGSDQVLDFRNEPGRGVAGVVRTAHSGLGMARRVLVGRPTWLAEQQVRTDELDGPFAAAEADGATAVMVAWDGSARGVLVLRDPVKATSGEAITQLRALGLRPVLLTGDSLGAARAAARAVGIDPDDVFAQVLPADKVDVVRRLQAEGADVTLVRTPRKPSATFFAGLVEQGLTHVADFPDGRVRPLGG